MLFRLCVFRPTPVAAVDLVLALALAAELAHGGASPGLAADRAFHAEVLRVAAVLARVHTSVGRTTCMADSALAGASRTNGDGHV